MSIHTPKFEILPVDSTCVECGKEAPLDTDYLELCEPCWAEKEQGRAEAAYERWCEDFYGGDTPQTDVERQAQALRQKEGKE